MEFSEAPPSFPLSLSSACQKVEEGVGDREEASLPLSQRESTNPTTLRVQGGENRRNAEKSAIEALFACLPFKKPCIAFPSSTLFPRNLTP